MTLEDDMFKTPSVLYGESRCVKNIHHKAPLAALNDVFVVLLLTPF
jgi:hypothetical protein